MVQRLRGKRMLIVDNNATSREILHNQAIAWGMRDGCASNGMQALEMLKHAVDNRDCYDLAVLDWHMPRMDGIELARKIHEDPAIPPLRIIMLCSAAFDEEMGRVKEVGINRYLIKPVRQDALFECLSEALNAPLEDKGAAQSHQRDHQNSSERPDAQEIEAEETVLHMEMLETLQAMQPPGAPSIVEEVIHIYLGEAVDLVEEIHKAAGSGDANSLRLAAHGLQSSSANVGAMQMAEICLELEMLGGEGHLQAAGRLLERLDAMYENVCAALNRRLQEQCAP